MRRSTSSWHHYAGAKNRRTAARSREKKRQELFDKQSENDKLSKIRDGLEAELEAANEIVQLLRPEVTSASQDEVEGQALTGSVLVEEPLEDVQDAFQEPRMENVLFLSDSPCHSA
jgi:hypothetical protein